MYIYIYICVHAADGRRTADGRQTVGLQTADGGRMDTDGGRTNGQKTAARQRTDRRTWNGGWTADRGTADSGRTDRRRTAGGQRTDGQMGGGASATLRVDIGRRMDGTQRTPDSGGTPDRQTYS